MASTTRRLLLQSRRSALSLPTRATPNYTPQWQQPQRALSSTPARSARSRDDDEEHQQRRPEKPKPPVKNTPEQTKAQLKRFAEDFRQMDPNYWKEAQRKGQTGIPILPNAELLPGEFDELPESATRVKQGFWAEGEESMGPDEDYHADDITSDGDGVLQQHRYLRKYARLVAWELPLLSRTSPLPLQNFPHEEVKNGMLIDAQTSQSPSSPPQPPPPSASATPPTWANRTRPPTKWSSSSPPPTWASPRSSATS